MLLNLNENTEHKKNTGQIYQNYQTRYFQEKPELNVFQFVYLELNSYRLKIVGSVSEGTDFGQKKNLNQRVYWFMV